MSNETLSDRLASLSAELEEGSMRKRLFVRYAAGDVAEVDWQPGNMTRYCLLLTQTHRGIQVTWLSASDVAGPSIIMTSGAAQMSYIASKMGLEDRLQDLEAILHLLVLTGHSTRIDYPLGYMPRFETHH